MVLISFRYHDEDHDNLLNAMWLIAVTILCVGYGDIVPNTYCGRSLAVVCGIMVSPLHSTQNPLVSISVPQALLDRNYVQRR